MDKIKFWANKIIEVGLNYSLEGNFIADIQNDFDDSGFILENVNEIYGMIARDERVADIEYNEKEHEFDIIFYLDYLPNYEILEIWEYGIIFKNNTDGYKRYDGEFIHEDKGEADNVFENYKEDVEQYYAKQWVKYGEDADWIENDVEVIYSDIKEEV